MRRKDLGSLTFKVRPGLFFSGIRFSVFKYRTRPQSTGFVVCFGGDKRDRTADLLNGIQALSQLSYTPMCGKVHAPYSYVEDMKEFIDQVIQLNCAA